MYKAQRDLSLLGILFGNVVSIVMAIACDWPLTQIMWIYWSQSVVIGIMYVIRMLSLKEFSTEGMTMNDQPVPETPAGKRNVAAFFALHCGIFHAVYAGFLWGEMPCVSAFVGSHSFSLMHNMKSDFKQKKPNLGTLMFYPYLRIIPMHMTIVFGGMLSAIGLPIFMVLKTLADVGMHMVEHHLFQKPDKTAMRMED